LFLPVYDDDDNNDNDDYDDHNNDDDDDDNDDNDNQHLFMLNVPISELLILLIFLS
jgi:hypothetical protein